VLYFDRSGWCVWAKRLEAGCFIADWSKARTHEIDCTQLKLLLEGIEPRRYLKRYRHDQPRAEEGVAHYNQSNSDNSRGAQLHGGLT
jgi:transposase